MLEEILEAWRTNNRINLLLIRQISQEGMGCTLSKRGGRGVAGQFAHIHNVRVWHLERRAKDLAAGLAAFEPKVVPSKRDLARALTTSGKAIESFFIDLTAEKPKRRGFKKGVASVLAYFVAHESHHRGNIVLTLKECGHKLEKDTAYGIWDWDRI